MQVIDTYTWVFALHMIVIGYYMGSDFVVDQWTWYLIKSHKDPAEERVRIRGLSKPNPPLTWAYSRPMKVRRT